MKYPTGEVEMVLLRWWARVLRLVADLFDPPRRVEQPPVVPYSTYTWSTPGNWVISGNRIIS